MKKSTGTAKLIMPALLTLSFFVLLPISVYFIVAFENSYDAKQKEVEIFVRSLDDITTSLPAPNVIKAEKVDSTVYLTEKQLREEFADKATQSLFVKDDPVGYSRLFYDIPGKSTLYGAMLDENPPEGKEHWYHYSLVETKMAKDSIERVYRPQASKYYESTGVFLFVLCIFVAVFSFFSLLFSLDKLITACKERKTAQTKDAA